MDIFPQRIYDKVMNFLPKKKTSDRIESTSVQPIEAALTMLMKWRYRMEKKREKKRLPKRKKHETRFAANL